MKTASVSRWVLKSDLSGCSCLNPARSCYGLPTLVTPVSNYTPTSTNTAAEKSTEQAQSGLAEWKSNMV